MPTGSAPTSLEAPPLRGGTKKQPCISTEPLRTDSAFQRRIHRPHQDQRRERIAKLLDVADREGVADLADIHPARKIASKLTGCCHDPTLYQDSDSGRLIASHARCKSRICPLCAQHRRRELVDRITNAMRHVDDPRMLTLTLAASNDALGDQLARLKTSFKALRRSKAWKAHIIGGLFVIEITYNPQRDQWHPHIHAIIDGEYWPQPQIADAWERVTGDSRIVDIRRMPKRSAVVNYVTKYVAKTESPQALPADRLAEWAIALHGARQFQTFGSLHNRATPCENTDDHGELEHVAPLSALADAAEGGDRRAVRLWNVVWKLTHSRLPDGDGPEADRALARHRSAARRVRAWWCNQQEPDHHNHPHRLGPRPPGRRARDRPQRLWQESKPPRFA